MQITTFPELGLSSKVIAAIEAAGYTTPTPIQAQAIPVAVTGRDVLGIAQTGTGKTAAFVMPMITRLETGRARARMPRSLILAPTRELAAQVAQSFEKYGVNHKLSLALLIGGVSMDDQIARLDRGVDVLIATPGRLLDHFGRGRVMLMGVEILVIDEADRMLDMGFIPDIEKICQKLPPRRQTLFFSATMPPEITRLVAQFLKDPVRIEVARPATTAKTIKQLFRYCPDSEDFAKREVLRDMIRSQPNLKNAIIFCNRKRDVAILLKSLLKHGFNAGALHGDMDQMSRMATLDKFRAGEIQLLAASDVAARGLDIPDVSHVFNFDVPWQADDYVHRIGRTGRAGREGVSATIVTPDDFKAVNEIAKLTGETPIWLGEAPTEADMAEGAKRKRGRGRGRSGAARGARSGAARGVSSGAARGPSGGTPRDPREGDARGAHRGEREDARRQGGEAARARSDRQPDEPRTAETPPIAAGRGGPPDLGGGTHEPRETREPRHDGERRGRRRRGRRGHDGPPREDRTGDASAASPEAAGAGDVTSPRREPRREERALREQRERHQPEHRGHEHDRSQDRRPPRADHDRGPPRERSPQQRQEYALSAQGRPTRARDQRPDRGPRVGFEDNVPAFLRKPVKA